MQMHNVPQPIRQGNIPRTIRTNHRNHRPTSRQVKKQRRLFPNRHKNIRLRPPILRQPRHHTQRNQPDTRVRRTLQARLAKPTGTNVPVHRPSPPTAQGPPLTKTNSQDRARSNQPANTTRASALRGPAGATWARQGRRARRQCRNRVISALINTRKQLMHHTPPQTSLYSRRRRPPLRDRTELVTLPGIEASHTGARTHESR